MLNGDELLKLGYSQFAKDVGQISRTEADKGALYEDYSARLDAILFSPRKGRQNQEEQFKIILGLSLLIACEKKDTKQRDRLNEVFLDRLDKLANSPKDQTRAREPYYMLLCELTYLDQFLLTSDLRKAVRNALPAHFKRFPQSAPYTDYETGLRLAEQNERLIDREESKSQPDDLQIILVGSVKGGVGKTLISIALAEHLINASKDARVALLDLDYSGPTLQYNLDVQEVTDGLSAWPKQHQKGQVGNWTYPTFADLVIPINLVKKRHPGTTLLNVNDDQGKNEPRLRAIVLPDSPTVTGSGLAPTYTNPLRSPDVILALDDLIRRRTDRVAEGQRFKFNYLVIDLGPGLFATNGLLFTWLTTRYHTSLLLVSSPRAFDLATSLYESVWLSAPNFLGWSRPIMQFLNMWPTSAGTVEDHLQGKTDVTLKKILTRRNSTSTDYILFWRLREYLYGVAVKIGTGDITTDTQDLGERYNIVALPYDNDLRGLLHSPDLRPFHIDEVGKTTWYSVFDRTMKSWLTQFGGRARR